MSRVEVSSLWPFDEACDPLPGVRFLKAKNKTIAKDTS